MSWLPEPASAGEPWSVSALNRYIKEFLGSDPVLQDLVVTGEIANFKRHTSGHMYFTLKDDQSTIHAVMFRGQNQHLWFSPENGMHVVARGSVGVYERDGTYQLYVSYMEPLGLGAQYLALELLKKRLAAEGLFNQKRSLPFLPRCVGVVTSPTGAAVRDIISVAVRRHPGVHILIRPVTVQGERAPREIVEALSDLNHYGECDVIIVGRGGGSQEDLWAFNDEGVARAIYASRVPVVSAVGHEIDLTVADLVADRRAPTPSAAAELVVPDVKSLRSRIDELNLVAARMLRRRLADARQRLRLLSARPVLARPLSTLAARLQRADELERRLWQAQANYLRAVRAHYEALAGRLEALSPFSILERGYAVATRPGGGPVISSARNLQAGEDITLVMKDGQAGCLVEHVSLREVDGDE